MNRRAVILDSETSSGKSHTYKQETAIMSKTAFNFIRVLTWSALLAGGVASAEIARPNKCPIANCPATSFLTPQIDTTKILESKITTLESKIVAQASKITALEENVNKLLTHKHEASAGLNNFSTFYAVDSYGKPQLVLQPLSGFGVSALVGLPKFN
jgi:hypothetical protein